MILLCSIELTKGQNMKSYKNVLALKDKFDLKYLVFIYI